MPDAKPYLPPIRKPNRRRLSRDEKARLTRESLLGAGYRVVAADGYAAASIAKIAETAGVAHGTFYNYFLDRQELFDQILPYEGLQMREKVEQAARKAPAGMEREYARFEAFLDYVASNDGFYRVLYEAEIFAVEAHRAHMENIVSGYKRTFGRAMTEGRMRRLDDCELECLIYQILGMRAYAAMQIHSAESPEKKLRIKRAAVEMYRLLLSHSLFETSVAAGRNTSA